MKLTTPNLGEKKPVVKSALSRGRVIVISLGVLIMVVTICVLYTVRQLAAPVHGQAPIGSSTLTQNKRAKKASGQIVSNDYFHLALPPGFVPQAVAPPDDSTLLAQTITGHSPEGTIIISISITVMPGEGLEAYPAYHSRQLQPDYYQLHTTVVSQQDVRISNDLRSASLVAFWPHGSYLATIGVRSGHDYTDPGQNESEERIIQTLLQGWQWQL